MRVAEFANITVLYIGMGGGFIYILKLLSKYMMEDGPLYRCLLLTENSKRLFPRDTDWLHIFSEIENHPESYKRYYPPVRVQLELEDVNLIVKALILNDEFYSYALTLSEKQRLKSTTCGEIKYLRK